MQDTLHNKLVCYHCQPWDESILYALTQTFALLLEKEKKAIKNQQKYEIQTQIE